ncbi:CFA/I fimbrial major subunit [Proteus hauseri ATCC 700826]|uniref:Common pilus major fimbrillin subunit EcpA n=1 Tax=Proteus hauseri ATCC 700826 TaxID=1354271 RepID=A0AAJ3HQ33_PROHU|nr:common pilus major fimbrillin subunit EcpA [Proteus hauseri]OAT45159.1 CFA/I fimbrial major subunit [Proteus hauseri ATCC 700826]
MKKMTSYLVLLLTFFVTHAVYAAEALSLQTTASWRATAVKKPQSELTITPLNALHFEFAENEKRFNSQSGSFDITVKDAEGATDFKLTSKIISNELKNPADKSVLTVNTHWNGKPLSTHNETTILDSHKGVNGGLVATNSEEEKSELKNMQSAFLFNLINNNQSAPLASLPNGSWEGSLRIEFTSKWSGDFVTLASR